MRFIHTADLHLGRLFYGKHLTDDQAYVLEELHAVIRETKPEAILISGDIYDRAVPPTEAVELLDATLARILLEAKVPVIMIAGNHDSPERVGFASKLLARQGLHVKGSLQADPHPVILHDDYGSVYFLPFPYAEPALVRQLFVQPDLPDHEAALSFLVEQGLKGVPKGVRKVALAHAFVAGGLESESERPLSVGASSSVNSRVFAPFHYTALGHLHNGQRAGSEEIRYAGSIMKYSFDEAAHHKGVRFVEMDAQGAVRSQHLPLRSRRDVCKVEGCFDDILRDRTRYPASEDYMMVSLKDNQAILDAHGQLQQVYPNLLQIERPYLMTGGTLRKAGSDYRTQSECQLFTDFFQQMTGEPLTEKQREAFDESYEALLAMQREVKL